MGRNDSHKNHCKQQNDNYVVLSVLQKCYRIYIFTIYIKAIERLIPKSYPSKGLRLMFALLYVIITNLVRTLEEGGLSILNKIVTICPNTGANCYTTWGKLLQVNFYHF